MNILTVIGAAINASSINTETAHDPSSTSGRLLSSQDYATYLSGLTKVQEDLIYCKYFSEIDHCRKGLKSYRAYLYRSKEFMQWVKYADNPDRLSAEYAETVMDRTSNSPILQQMAWEEMIAANRCPTCLGAGRWDTPESGIEAFDCEECKGKGVVSPSLSAQYKADRLHVSVSTYWRKWDKPFHYWFKKPLITQETEGLLRVLENWNRA